MVKYLLFFLFAATSAHAGLFGGPSAKDLEKVIRAPVVGKSDLPVREFISFLESRAGHRGSWSGDQFVIEMRDKATLKIMKQKYNFEFTDTEAILNEVIAGKDVLDGQVVGWLFMNFYNETDKGKANEKRQRAAEEAAANEHANKAKAEQEQLLKEQTLRDDERKAKQKLQAEKEKQRIENEKVEQNAKAISAIAALTGKHCSSFNGTKIEIANDGKSNMIFSVSENKCSMTKQSLPITNYYDSGVILVKLASANGGGSPCMLQVRPSSSGEKKSLSFGVDCDDKVAKQALGCNYDNLLTSFEPCD